MTTIEEIESGFIRLEQETVSAINELTQAMTELATMMAQGQAQQRELNLTLQKVRDRIRQAHALKELEREEGAKICICSHESAEHKGLTEVCTRDNCPCGEYRSRSTHSGSMHYCGGEMISGGIDEPPTCNVCG